MKAKTFGLLSLSVLVLIMFMSAVSADIDFVSVTGATQTVAQGSTVTVSFELEEDGTGNATNIDFKTPITLTSGSNNILSDATVAYAINYLTVNTTSTAGMSLNFTIPLTQARGIYTGNLAPEATYNDSINPLTITLTIDHPHEVQACSAIGNLGNDLKVKDIDFTNRGMSQNQGLSHTKFGDDDEWFPLDDIEVDIEIENNGNDDIDDIEVEWGIYNIKTNEWIIELDDEKDFNLKDDDEETITISFQLEDDLDVDFDKLDEGKYYRFYVIATGTVDDAGSSPTCVSKFKTAEIIIESDFVVLDNIGYPETVMCGETVQITADVWNIGEDDQDEVSVDLVAKGLGLDKTTLIGDIDAFDNDKFSLTFTIPENAEEKTHTLKFQVWDEDNDVYENDFDEDESEFFLPLKVKGNCAATEEITISASLESEAKAGKEMVISVLLTNTADVTRSFTMQASGYDAWAELSELPGLLTLNADSVGEVLLKLDIKKGISGEQTFLIMVYSDNELIATQSVSVNIESARPFLGITGLVTTDNAYLWGIGLLNIILIVIIILVAVRIARRK